MSKLEKEKLKLVQEKCQSLLNDMLRDEDNKYCVDCDAKGPRWASWNLGIFLCIRCAGIHRNLGVHISKVKSVNLDTWTPEQVVTVQAMGNSRARAVYEAFLPDNFRRPQTDSTLETFIRAKYEHKKYIAKEWVMPKVGKVDWDSEIEEALRAKKSSTRSEIKLPPLPKPPTNTAAQVKQKPIEVANGGSIAKSISSASSDLLGLTTTTTPSTTQQQSNNNFNFLNEEPSLSLVDTTTTVTGTDPSTTPSTKSVNDDLGSIFLSSPPVQPSPADNQLLTKESILSLYKNTSPASGAPQQQQPGLNTLNPFLNYQPSPIQQQQQQPIGGNFGYGGGQFIGGQQQQGSNSLDFMQLSSQMSGLGLTNTAQPAYQAFPQPQQQQQQHPNMLGQFNQFNQFNNIPNFYNQPPQPQPQYQPKYK